ncbi:hypothetical protein lerEdw1_016637 [Lerista edwardsae]|nr:hypothetical protein lerEdw1_016637 [Lerista edwardsae]
MDQKREYGEEARGQTAVPEDCAASGILVMGGGDFHRYKYPGQHRLRCMAVHNADFITDDDSWENSSAEFEQRFQLGSEMASLSRSASSSEKFEMLDNFHVKFNLSQMR